MANALYDKGREAFLAGDLAWDTDAIRLVMVSAGYVVDLAVHQFLSDVLAADRVATSPAFTGKTVVAGVADANDVTVLAVSGADVVAIVVYQDSGVETTSRLIAYIDTATGLPFTPAGVDMPVEWDDGVNKVFKL